MTLEAPMAALSVPAVPLFSPRVALFSSRVPEIARRQRIDPGAAFGLTRATKASVVVRADGGRLQPG